MHIDAPGDSDVGEAIVSVGENESVRLTHKRLGTRWPRKSLASLRWRRAARGIQLVGRAGRVSRPTPACAALVTMRLRALRADLRNRPVQVPGVEAHGLDDGGPFGLAELLDRGEQVDHGHAAGRGVSSEQPVLDRGGGRLDRDRASRCVRSG